MTRKETTIEQSERLVAVGVDPKTADVWCEDYPVWSIAAVLTMLPQNVDGECLTILKGASGNWHVTYNYIWGTYDTNLLEACVTMYEHLHQNNLL